MKRRIVILSSALALLAFAFAAQPAECNPSPAPQSSAVYQQQDEQAQREVQAALAKAQAELARALQEVQSKVVIKQKLQKELAAKLAKHRTAMLADLHVHQAKLAALAKAKAARAHFEPQIALAQELSEGGWLGVQIAEVDAEKVKELKLPAERGVLITEVEKDSPAAKAGLKANDVVTEFNGQRIESTTQFRRMIRESLPGRSAQLTVWREGRAQTLSVTLGSSSDRFRGVFTFSSPRDFHFDFSMPEIFVSSRTPTLGISAQDISGQLGTYFGVPGGEGVLVREVNSGSPAEKAGMKAGDVITKIDGDKVRSLSEMREKLRAKREQKTVSIGVIRKGGEVSLNVEIEQPKPPEGRRIRITRRSAL